MRPPLSTYAPQEYLKPVVFRCKVNNTILTAKIYEELDNPVCYHFKIRFGDGVDLDVTSSESDHWWVEDPKYLPYLRAVEKPLTDFIMVKDYEWQNFEFNCKGTDLIVWISQVEDESYGTAYKVYFHGYYQFHLRKGKHGWEAKSIKIHEFDVDEDLAALISLKIETESTVEFPKVLSQC